MENRWHYLPIGLVIASVLAVCTATLANAAVLGWWQALIYAGCAAALAATVVFRRELSLVEVELDRVRQRIAADEQRLADERRDVEALSRTVEAELKSQAARLDRTVVPHAVGLGSQEQVVAIFQRHGDFGLWRRPRGPRDQPLGLVGRRVG